MELTHSDEEERARTVDVSDKNNTTKFNLEEK